MRAGELGSPKELQRFALEAFPSLVTRISAATLHAFVATDALAPAVLLFTDKDETPGSLADPRLLSVACRVSALFDVHLRSPPDRCPAQCGNAQPIQDAAGALLSAGVFAALSVNLRKYRLPLRGRAQQRCPAHAAVQRQEGARAVQLHPASVLACARSWAH